MTLGIADFDVLAARHRRELHVHCYRMLASFGDSRFRAFKLDVLRIADGRLQEITTFGPALFEHLGLPAELPPLSP